MMMLLREFRRRLHENKVYKEWKKQGMPLPPPHILKVSAVRKEQSKLNRNILIESGTYYGTMVAAQEPHFNNILSIELDRTLYVKAASKFARKRKIQILHGDSGQIIPQLLSKINEPVLFWLDGHYSGGETAKGDSNTPILNELKAIVNHPYENVILIDDARLFNGLNQYPMLEEIETIFKNHQRNYSFSILHDIIYIRPKNSGSIKMNNYLN